MILYRKTEKLTGVNICIPRLKDTQGGILMLHVCSCIRHASVSKHVGFSYKLYGGGPRSYKRCMIPWRTLYYYLLIYMCCFHGILGSHLSSDLWHQCSEVKSQLSVKIMMQFTRFHRVWDSGGKTLLHG